MPDTEAPQVEPLTLEEALQRLYAKGLTLIPPSDDTDSWGIGVASDSPDEEFDTWHEAVSAVEGVPVVPRDDTAALVEAVEAYFAAEDHLDATMDDRYEVSDTRAAAEAVIRRKDELRQALSRVKGGELGEGWDEPYAHRDPGNARPARTARKAKGER